MQSPKELEEKLSRLKDILSEMKALLEWQKLKYWENTRNPSMRLLFSDYTAQQLSGKYAQFLSISIEVDQILKTHALFAKRSSILKELNTLHWQVYYLGTDVRVY